MPSAASSARYRFSTTMTPSGVERLGDDEGLPGIFGWDRPVAPRVTARHRYPMVGQPVGHGHPGAGLARSVAHRVVVPQPAPTGVKQHGIAGTDVDAGDVVGCDHVAGLETGDAPSGGDVDEQAPGDDLGQGVGAELRGAVGGCDVLDPVPVVSAAVAVQVVERVHVGAHLRRGVDTLDDEAQAVGSGDGLWRVELLAERPSLERRDVHVQDVGEVVDPAATDRTSGADNAVGADLVQGAGFIGGAIP